MNLFLFWVFRIFILNDIKWKPKHTQHKNFEINLNNKFKNAENKNKKTKLNNFCVYSCVLQWIIEPNTMTRLLYYKFDYYLKSSFKISFNSRFHLPNLCVKSWIFPSNGKLYNEIYEFNIEGIKCNQCILIALEK